MKVKEILCDESKWCKGAFAKTPSGNDVLPEDEDACRWCLYGALGLAYPNPRDFHKAEQKIREICVRPIDVFNDHPDTTFADIRAVLELADV